MKAHANSFPMDSEIHHIGIVGHRDLGTDAARTFVEWNLYSVLRSIRAKHPSLVAMSALAEGSDSLFAQIAINLHIELVSILPYEQALADFDQPLASARYQDLRKHADREINIDFPKKDDLAHRKSMNLIAFKSNTLIAVWNGRQEGPIGGTWETVNLCMEMRKTMIHLNCADRSVELHANRKHNYSRISNIRSSDISLYI